MPRFNQLRKYFENNEGGVAIEFAFIFPVLFSLYVGAAEVNSYINADRKISTATRNLADIIAQEKSVDTSTLNDIYYAAGELIKPLKSSDQHLGLIITAIDIDSKKNAKVVWSYAMGLSKEQARSRGSLIAIPDEVNVENSSRILVEGKYLYSPITKFIFPNASYTLRDKIYIWPRHGTGVTCTNC